MSDNTIKLQKALAKQESLSDVTIENHPNCPMCGSSNTKTITDRGSCLCGGDCWSHPECLDCGYRGYMNSNGIFWKNWDRIKSLKRQLETVKKNYYE